ncbi:MAG: oxygenase MpaB family protein, partial [Ilumatobacteraceae bacterium]|nr:oxygenase MpaB family protein [Ilumatobacteraceae bacterium]
VGADFTVSPRAESMLGDSFRRLGGTAEFLDRFFSRDESERQEALAAVRGMHDGWRQRVNDLYRDDSKRPRALCDPVGDEQILGTACTFVTPVHELFAEFRVPAPGIDWDAWARVWCDIAVAQGADARYVRDRVTGADGTVTFASMARAAAAIELAHRDRTYGGVRLMANLLRDLRDGLPHWSRSSFLGALAVFGEPDVLDLLLVPPRPERRWGRAIALAVVATPGLRSAFWWWVDRSIRQVRGLVAEADRGRPLADLDRAFPGHIAGVRRVPLPG